MHLEEVHCPQPCGHEQPRRQQPRMSEVNLEPLMLTADLTLEDALDAVANSLAFHGVVMPDNGPQKL